ncbi:hypothetical protein MN116_002593 [Schistosoma mekongi]|uniref:Selenoprotein W n=1 Tax=Schistosoma mekongi TaxID=38744 RepID=A0AAE1ZG85_SCHME|nr:hypothetical protein MN116_002593 [Schistosoma mekongi]
MVNKSLHHIINSDYLRESLKVNSISSVAVSQATAAFKLLKHAFWRAVRSSFVHTLICVLYLHGVIHRLVCSLLIDMQSNINKLEVHIEHWYVAQHLAKAIEQKCKAASVNIHEGRPRSFEITVNGVLIFSKLKCGRFPLTEAVVSKVIAIAHGETPKEVIDYETSNCNLL